MPGFVEDSADKVYLLTATHEGRKSGCILTWAVTASLNRKTPKLILVVSRYNATLEILERSRKFCLSSLEKYQKKEFIHFGTLSSREVDKFSELSYESTLFGPVIGGTSGHALGTIDAIFETPDRKILYCSIIEEIKTPRECMRLGEILQKLDEKERRLLERKMEADSLRDENHFTGP